jgi:hypothetical protein
LNPLQVIQAQAGQKVHETFYAATFRWRDKNIPCAHGDIVKNPPLIEGGFSPNVEVTISIRVASLIAADLAAYRPAKGDWCSLTPWRGSALNLRVETVATNTGDAILVLNCVSRNQNA